MKQQVLIVNPKIVLREDFEDVAVLFNPDNGKTFSLNKTGLVIWKSIDGSRTVSEIIDDMKARCVGIPESVEEQVQKYIQRLLDSGLIGTVVD